MQVHKPTEYPAPSADGWRSFKEAVGAAVIESYDSDCAIIVGKEGAGDDEGNGAGTGAWVTGRRVPACVLVGVARNGQWLPILSVADLKYLGAY